MRDSEIKPRNAAPVRQMPISRLALLATATLAAALIQMPPKLIPLIAAAQAPETPPTVASVVEREISSVEQQILDVAEAMPEEKFNFSPENLNIRDSDYQGVRSFAVQLKHAAASNYFIWSHLTGDKLPKGLNDGNGPAELKTKAEIILFVKRSFALGHKAAATLNTDNLLQAPEGSKSTRLHLAEFGVAHAYDHYGQMVEYLRMNGIVPPASRKKSE
jgi:DinB superfamily